MWNCIATFSFVRSALGMFPSLPGGGIWTWMGFGMGMPPAREFWNIMSGAHHCLLTGATGLSDGVVRGLVHVVRHSSQGA